MPFATSQIRKCPYFVIEIYRLPISFVTTLYHKLKLSQLIDNAIVKRQC